MPKREKDEIELIRTWTLPATVTMGSAVRAKGVLQEIQARLPATSKKSISLEGVDLTLAMTANEKTSFNAAAAIVAKVVAEAGVRLNGRARQITFHVFDPKVVEDLLDRGAAEEWRVEDAEAKAEKRQRATYQAKLTRSLKREAAKRSKKSKDDAKDSAPKLGGWEEFDVDGLLR
ncbi:hypothetical protein [Agrobacterium sp. fls2-241-TYG-188a]|uniref:hypothetical protein n=1 Tax=Agrobacterium sp. fls2-241-TYG-188a TaxID=3040275 RepID=UPI00254CFB63|nr:hypothetical protein [Agrobacterium sp. fls2-241-TYG-188a]